MTKIINIRERIKPRIQIVKTNEDEKREYDKLHAALSSALHSLKAARNWTEFEKTHLLNCRDAMDRAAFYIDDEINEKINHDN